MIVAVLDLGEKRHKLRVEKVGKRAIRDRVGRAKGRMEGE